MLFIHVLDHYAAISSSQFLWCLLPTQVSGLETHMHYSDPGQSGSHSHNTLRLNTEVTTSSQYSGHTVWTRCLGISTALGELFKLKHWCVSLCGWRLKLWSIFVCLFVLSSTYLLIWCSVCLAEHIFPHQLETQNTPSFTLKNWNHLMFSHSVVHCYEFEIRVCVYVHRYTSASDYICL